MDQNTDLTVFWLAWRETCSIRRCLDGKVLSQMCKDVPEVMDNPSEAIREAKDVLQTTNGYFRYMVGSPRKPTPLGGKKPHDEEENEGSILDETCHIVEDDGRHLTAAENDFNKRLAESLDYMSQEEKDEAQVKENEAIPHRATGAKQSEYIDLVRSWSCMDYDAKMPVCAFELMESHLYNKGTLNGRKFKDYLFEDIATRPGGMCKNLFGYLLKKNSSGNVGSVLRTVANASFSDKNIIDNSFTGNATPDQLEDHFSRMGRGYVGRGKDNMTARAEDPASIVERTEHLDVVREKFRGYIEPRWMGKYDVSDRVAICAAFFANDIVASSAFVLELVQIGKSALGEKLHKHIRAILEENGFDLKTSRVLMSGPAKEVLIDCMLRHREEDDTCIRLLEHFGYDLSDKA